MSSASSARQSPAASARVRARPVAPKDGSTKARVDAEGLVEEDPRQDQDDQHKGVGQQVFPAEGKPRNQKGHAPGSEEVNGREAPDAVLVRALPRLAEDIRVLAEARHAADTYIGAGGMSTFT